MANNKASDNLSGQELSKLYCSACHMYPDPSLLNKDIWKNGILPQMGARMGIRDALKDPYKGMTAMDKMIVKNAGIFPEIPLISDMQWDKIKIFYYSHAPEKLPEIRRDNPLDTNQTLFDFKPVTLDLPKGGMTTLVRQNPFTKQIYIGDGRNLLIITDSKFKLLKKIDMPSPPLDIEFVSANECWVTCVGILHPNEQHQGKLVKLDSAGHLSTLIGDLRRPVYTRLADLNPDGKTDLVISEYGNNIGELSWFENLGNNQFKKHIFRNYPGSIQSFVMDFNSDGLPDVISLFAQADESIYTFINKGDGEFSSKLDIRFPPVYGSSYFNMADFNNDGFKDILYVNGDNADFSFTLKPYHGARIFLNDGKNNYSEKYFFPMYGASYGDVYDYDGDGDEDMVIIAFFPDFETEHFDNVIYLENTTESILSFKPYNFPDSQNGRWIIVGRMDYEQDGDMDLLLGSFTYSAAPTPLGIRRKWFHDNIHIAVLENQSSDKAVTIIK